MATRRSRPVALLVLLSAALLLCGLVVAWRHERGPWFRYQTGPLSDEDQRALDSGGAWRKRVFATADGLALSGLERQGTAPNTPKVLFFPGNSAQSLSDGRRFLSRLAGSRDWQLVVFAYRGFSGNKGEPEPAALENDARSIFQQLTVAAGDEGPVHVIGYSLGASIAAAVAASAAPRTLASLTLVAPTPHLVMRQGRFSTADHYDALGSIERLSCPVLVIHGQLDTTLPVEGGRQVARRLAARFEVLPHLGHHDVIESDRTLSLIRQFIVKQSR